MLNVKFTHFILSDFMYSLSQKKSITSEAGIEREKFTYSSTCRESQRDTDIYFQRQFEKPKDTFA